MRLLNKRRKAIFRIAFCAMGSVLMFQNCGESVSFKHDVSTSPTGSLEICNGISCELEPLTKKVAVTTILIALGDEADRQLVVNGASAQLLAETVVRYTFPKANPKILLVRDDAAGTESKEDTTYVQNTLLARFDVTFLQAAQGGLKPSDVEGFDIVWLNNPGAPMGSKATRDTLLSFKGGLVIQGDDMSRGKDFELEDLTGLKYIDNGTSVKCGDKTYNHNDNGGEQYRIRLNPERIPGVDNSVIDFRYGNDIDLTEVIRTDLEVLAYAKGGPESCVEERPAIVRYLKD